MEEYSYKYLVSEMNGLRSEINLKLDEINKTFRFALTAFGASMAWLLVLPAPKPSEEILRVVASAIPFFLCFFISLHANRVRNSIINVTTYIRRIEDKISFPDLGWEHSDEVKPLNNGGHIKTIHDATYTAMTILSGFYLLFNYIRYFTSIDLTGKFFSALFHQ